MEQNNIYALFLIQNRYADASQFQFLSEFYKNRGFVSPLSHEKLPLHNGMVKKLKLEHLDQKTGQSLLNEESLVMVQSFCNKVHQNKLTLDIETKRFLPVLPNKQND